MKKTLCLLATSAILTAGPALAGSLDAPAPETPITPAAPVVGATPDWTGFYGGAEIGYGSVDTNVPGVNGDGLIGGVTLGYDADLGNWVIGGALDYDWTDINIAPGATVDSVFRAKLRGGYKIGNGLLYGTGGYARADTNVLGDDNGYFVGAGYEQRLSDRFSLGGEVLWHDFNNFNGTTTDITATTVQLRGTLRF